MINYLFKNGAFAVVVTLGLASAAQAGSSKSFDSQQFQSGMVTATLNGQISNVYTYRTYAAGRNGGSLVAKVDVNESLTGTISAGSSIGLNFTNAAAGTTNYPALSFSTVTPSFANVSGAFNAPPGQYLTQGGYSATPTVFTSSRLSYLVASPSVSVLQNTIQFNALTIGNKEGPVTVDFSFDRLGALPPISIANALNATNTSVVGSLPQAAVGGGIIPAVTLPGLKILETSAGALATETGGSGQASVALTNAIFDINSSISATWCGNALPSANISGGTTTTLTIVIPSVSTAPCALIINSKAIAQPTAAPGSKITATINGNLTDTAQPTFQQVTVGSIGGGINDPTLPIFPATIAVASSTTQTGLQFLPSFTPASSDNGKIADTYVIAYYQGIFLYKKKTPVACAGWTVFLPQSGNVPQQYETGVILGATYQLGNINDCDVTSLKGVFYYLGYGVGASNPQTWNAMLTNGTFSNSPVFLTN